MTKKRSAKKALILSVLSLLLCCAMLIGTTFAWFTDSVTSANNTIVAGNLDVELEYLDNGTWKKVTETTNVFMENALWEPGRTEVVYLRISNQGTLALEFNLGVRIANEIYGTNVAGEELRLSEYIEYDVVEDVTTPYATREEARTAAKDDTTTAPARLHTGTYSEKGKLYPVGNPDGGATEKYLAMVVYMPESIGNEANYRGTPVPTIELGLYLNATQYTYESDTFGIDYDGAQANAAPPVATVTPDGAKTITATIGMGGAAQTMTAPFTFTFKTNETAEQAAKSPYRYYHVDFVVSADKDLPADCIALVGYYPAYCEDYNDGHWVAMTNGSDAITAGTQIRLLELLLNGGSINYEELCQWIPEFKCGALAYSESNPAVQIPAGTTLTVELRMYETTADPSDPSGPKNIETGVYTTIHTETYTFN